MTSTTAPALRRAASWAAAAALALSPLTLATATEAAQARAASYKVTAKINTDTAIAKETIVKVKGRVTPKAAGQKVILQQRVGTKKKWTATGDAKVKANGTYKLTDKPSTPGSREYRVVKPASKGIGKGVSKPLAVTVYRWEKLGYRTPGPETNVSQVGAVIGTDYYAASLVTEVAGTDGAVEFTLGRKCLELRSTYALTDQSPTGSTGSVTVSTDGAVKAVHALAVGTVVADDVIDISDAFRLKFDLTASATPAAITAVATPEVLCTR